MKIFYIIIALHSFVYAHTTKDCRALAYYAHRLILQLPVLDNTLDEEARIVFLRDARIAFMKAIGEVLDQDEACSEGFEHGWSEAERDHNTDASASE